MLGFGKRPLCFLQLGPLHPKLAELCLGCGKLIVKRRETLLGRLELALRGLQRLREAFGARTGIGQLSVTSAHLSLERRPGLPLLIEARLKPSGPCALLLRLALQGVVGLPRALKLLVQGPLLLMGLGQFLGQAVLRLLSRPEMSLECYLLALKRLGRLLRLRELAFGRLEGAADLSQLLGEAILRLVGVLLETR